MRREDFFAVFCFLLASAIFVAGCTGPGVIAQENNSRAVAGLMTAGDLAVSVQNASGFAESVGKEAAIAEFSKKDGLFSRGNAYVYAHDVNGTLLAHPYLPEEAGKNRTDATDIRGLPFVRIGTQTASNGGGFIAYLYPAPGGESINESARDAYVPKIGYVAPVGDSWWIGSGLYFSDMAGCGSDGYPEPVSRMVTLVEECAAFGRGHAQEIAFLEISNRSGRFVNSEEHYIYAYDYNGTLLAHPYLQDLIGTSLIEREDSFGMKNIRALCDTSRTGGGFIVFVWPNPARENREEIKIGYVLPVDDEWWVGSGVYLSEITGE
jgi:two-component system, NarL family, sensor kinase